MMTKLLSEVSDLVSRELERANRDNPPFHSRHEGYAVILEEAEELSEETECVFRLLAELWETVKANKAASTEELKQAAIRAACEAVQVAAMAEKFEGVMG